MRANSHAETEIRALMFNAYLCLAAADPILFGDYEVVSEPDGTFTVANTYRKV
jgi:thymidylate synthase (FAD)